jgi:WD40 repeat protein
VLRHFSGHSSSVTSVAFSPDGKTLASGSKDHTIKLWDVASGLELLTLKGHSSPTAVAFSPDGKTLADESDKNSARLWSISTGTMLALARSASAYSGELSRDGKTLARISDNVDKLIEVATSKEIHTIRPHPTPTQSL